MVRWEKRQQFWKIEIYSEYWCSNVIKSLYNIKSKENKLTQFEFIFETVLITTLIFFY